MIEPLLHRGACVDRQCTRMFDNFPFRNRGTHDAIEAVEFFFVHSDIFGMNVEKSEFDAVSEAAGLPVDKAQFFFTPTVVNTGAELILFDAGLSAEATTAALAAAGKGARLIASRVVSGDGLATCALAGRDET